MSGTESRRVEKKGKQAKATESRFFISSEELEHFE
jgi:hypothetical protein